MTCGSSGPYVTVVTANARAQPLRHGPSTDQGDHDYGWL